MLSSSRIIDTKYENSGSHDLDPITLNLIPSLNGKKGAEELLNTLNQFRKTISITGETLGNSSLTELEIDTGDSSPLFTRQFGLPHKHKGIM